MLFQFGDNAFGRGLDGKTERGITPVGNVVEFFRHAFALKNGSCSALSYLGDFQRAIPVLSGFQFRQNNGQFRVGFQQFLERSVTAGKSCHGLFTG